VEKQDPKFYVEYVGKGIWHITKQCNINSADNGAWFYYDMNGKMDEDPAYFGSD
jgi:hypothetical protein